MDTTNQPINQKTMENFTALLGRFVTNLGGNPEFIKEALQQCNTLEEMESTLYVLAHPVMGVHPFTAYHQNPDGTYHNNYLLVLNGWYDKAKESGREITMFSLQFCIQSSHANVKQLNMFVTLAAGVEWQVVFLASKENYLATPKQDLTSNIGLEKLCKDLKIGQAALKSDELYEQIHQVMIATAKAIPAEALDQDGRICQEVALQALNTVKPKKHLDLAEELAVKLPELMAYLEKVFQLPKDELMGGRFTPLLSEHVQTGISLTANDLGKYVLDHPAINKPPFSVARIDEKNKAHLFAMGIHLPLDNQATPVDTLCILISPEGLMITLKGGGLLITEHHSKLLPSSFDPQNVTALTRASEKLSAEQAAANRAFLTQALQALGETATGASREKINDAVLMLKTAS